MLNIFCHAIMFSCFPTMIFTHISRKYVKGNSRDCLSLPQIVDVKLFTSSKTKGFKRFVECYVTSKDRNYKQYL